MPDIPKELSAALKKAGLTAFFAGCTAAHQREYIKWIAEAKKPEARIARSAKAASMLSAKKAKEDAKSAP